MVNICSVSNFIFAELNTVKESLHEHEEKALLPMDFLVVYMSLQMCKRREKQTGALVKTNERGERKRAAKRIVGTFFVVFRVKCTNENGSDGE